MTALEEQIAVLKSAGIELNPGVTITDLLTEMSLEDYESDPYIGLLSIMGENDKLSDDVWHFDTECVEGSGSYVLIAHSFRVLSNGLLPLEHVQDNVNNNGISVGTGWLSFYLHGQLYKWDLKIEDDWVDADVFSRFVQLYDQQNPSKRFILCSLGQDGIIACATPQQLEFLNQQTGLEFDWLT